MTEQDKKDYLDYLKTQGFSEKEALEYYDYSNPKPTSGTQKVVNKASEVAQKALSSAPAKAVMSVLDYPRSALVGGAQAMGQKVKQYYKGLSMLPTEPVEGVKTIATAPFAGKEAFIRGVTGKTPGLATVLEEEGVPELGRVSDVVPQAKDTVLDLTGRGVIGGVGDIATDVFAGNLAGNLVKSGGKKLYKSAFSESDEIAKQFKKSRLPSDIAFENRAKVAGGEADIKRGIQEVLDDKLKERQAIIDMVEASGSEANLPRATAETREVLEQWLDPTSRTRTKQQADIAERFQKGLDDSLEYSMPKEPTEIYTGTETILRKKPQVQVTNPKPPSGRIQTISERQVGGFTPASPVDVPVSVDRSAGLLPPETVMERQYLDMIPETQQTKAYLTPDTPANLPGEVDIKILERKRPGYRTTERVPGVGIQGTMNLKSQAYGDIADDAWREYAKTPEGQGLLKKLARGLREETETLADEFQSGLGAKLASQNEDIGSLLTTIDTYSKDAMKQARRPGVTQVDMMALAADPTIAAAKNIGRFGRSPLAKTKGGRLLYDTVAPMTKRGIQIANPILNLVDDATKEQILLDMQGQP